MKRKRLFNVANANKLETLLCYSRISKNLINKGFSQLTQNLQLETPKPPRARITRSAPLISSRALSFRDSPHLFQESLFPIKITRSSIYLASSRRYLPFILAPISRGPASSHIGERTLEQSMRLRSGWGKEHLEQLIDAFTWLLRLSEP